MVDVKKFLDRDLYGLLAIDISAEEPEVSNNKLPVPLKPNQSLSLTADPQSIPQKGAGMPSGQEPRQPEGGRTVPRALQSTGDPAGQVCPQRLRPRHTCPQGRRNSQQTAGQQATEAEGGPGDTREGSRTITRESPQDAGGGAKGGDRATAVGRIAPAGGGAATDAAAAGPRAA